LGEVRISLWPSWKLKDSCPFTWIIQQHQIALEMEETNIIFNPTFITLKFNILTFMRTCVSSNHSTICAILVGHSLWILIGHRWKNSSSSPWNWWGR
jgi:hypothetical protein